MFNIVTGLLVFDKTFTDTSQCNIQVIDPKKAPNPPARVTGAGTGKTADAACTPAKKMQPKKRRPEPMPDIANVNLLKLENQECCNIQK
jgi:hypothetical protein